MGRVVTLRLLLFFPSLSFDFDKWFPFLFPFPFLTLFLGVVRGGRKMTKALGVCEDGFRFKGRGL